MFTTVNKKITSLEDELESISEECKSLTTKLKELTALPTNKEADAKIEKLTAEVCRIVKDKSVRIKNWTAS